MTQDILDQAISQNTQPNQPAPTAQPATTQPATAQPVGAAASSGDILDQAISHNTGQSPDGTPAVSGQPTSTARPAQNPAAKHGLLARAWDWVNQPIFDNVLPRDIKTSDIVKAAAFEKMFGEAYIPGVNDFDTKAESHMGGAKGEKPTDSALKNAIRTFIAGSAKDTADMASSFTSPLSIGTLSLGEIGKGVGVIPKLARTVSPLVGTAFGLQGLYHGAHGGFDIAEHGATPENTQEMLGGLGQAALAGGEGLRDARNRVNTLKENVRPVTKTVAGQDIPVRADTKAGRFAAKLVEPETLTKAAENTASAVQQGVGEVAKGATGSDADTSIKGEDRFGLRGHANDLIENKARPVFKVLDELSNGKFSEAQKAEKTARRVGDFDKMNEAIEKQDTLTEEFRDQLNERGLDPDEAWDNYRKGIAVQKLASQFDTATAAKDTGIGYQVKGDKLANTIDRIRRTAPEKNLFTRAGFSDSHVDALAELADTLRNEQNIPQFKSYQRLAAKALAGAIGFGHSGVLGLAEALTGESAAESVVRKGATSLLGKAMMSEPATRELTDALKDGDTDKGTAAVQNMATADPTWWNGLKSTLQTAWEKYKASPLSSEKGAVGMDINQPVKRLGGFSDSDLAPTFFSKAERVANDKVNSGSGDSILAALRNNGVKESEIQWLGLDDYLEGKPKVSKADVQQYINDHKIALNEVNLGGDRAGLTDLGRQRDKVFAENNRIWADHLRYADGSTELFNAMGEGRDVEPLISKMPESAQEPARRFVETDRMIHDFDKQLADANRTAPKPAKFEQYTLPGEKQNYTEKLLTLPMEEQAGKPTFSVKQSASGHEWSVVNDRGGVVLTAGTPEYAQARAAELNAEGLPAHLQDRDGRSGFRSSHFDEPNVLAHARYDDRTSLDGKKTLFLEELQSDWHQKGKKEGYQNPAPTTLPDGIFISPEAGKFQVVNREGNPLLSRLFGTEQEAKTAALTHYGEGAGNSGVPDAPFKSDWHELVLKRMLRHAAENGYDRLAWTTGDQQAARYDLSKQVDKISYDPETKTLNAYKDGDTVLNEHGIEPQEVQNYVGKDPAKKVLSSEPDEMGFHTATGDDLKIGGDWAKALYDRAIPNFLNKYAKKWNAKVGETELSTTNPGSLRYEIVDPKGNVQDAFRNRAGAEEAAQGYQQAHRGPGKWTVRDNGTREKVHSIEITPAMKKSVLQEGQPIAKNEPVPSVAPLAQAA